MNNSKNDRAGVNKEGMIRDAISWGFKYYIVLRDPETDKIVNNWWLDEFEISLKEYNRIKINGKVCM